MKKTLLTLLCCLVGRFAFAEGIFYEGFEYANHDLQTPVGWICPDQSWRCGYQDKDHNRIPHTGNWYAFTDSDDAWMFMPLFGSQELRYRYTYWAISDGSYQMEVWVGDEASPSQMTQMLFAEEISSGNYECFTAYIENIVANYQYFGFHAVAAPGAYHLTIDDIVVDMVGKYDMEVTPFTFDTILSPGAMATIHYTLQNTGYEPLEIFMTPISEYFTDVHFYVNGTACTSIPTEPNDAVEVTCTAVLLPNLEPGTVGWMDIMFTVSCDCVTRMATLWVTVADFEETSQHETKASMSPNPASDFTFVSAHALQGAEIRDLTGKLVLKAKAEHDDLRLDLTSLPTGMYFVTTFTAHGISTHKLMKR